MKLYITLTKRNLAVILAVIIAVFILLGQFSAVGATAIDGSTNLKRIEYLNRLSLEVDQTPNEVKDIIIPEDFSQVYQNYNKLQIKAGFNLENFKGKTATVYTYEFLQTAEKEVHLIVSKGKIIGGDIAETKVNGKMLSLKG